LASLFLVCGFWLKFLEKIRANTKALIFKGFNQIPISSFSCFSVFPSVLVAFFLYMISNVGFD
jgi:hypothetical protein